jgi:hypothetical protein
MPGSLSLLDDAVYTIAARIKCYEEGTAEFTGPRHIYTELLSFNEELHFRLNGLGELAGFHRTPTATVNMTNSGTRVDDNRWHNVVLRRSASDAFEILLDGSIVVSSTGTDPGVTTITPNIAYGNWHKDAGPDVSDGPLFGTLSRIAVWQDDALSDAETESFLNNGTLPSAGNPTWWHDPGTSDPEYDYAKNGNVGTVVGGVVVNADPTAGFDQIDLALGAIEIPLYLPDLTLEHETTLGTLEIPFLLPAVVLESEFDLDSIEIPVFLPDLASVFDQTLDVGAIEIPLFLPSLSLENDLYLSSIEIPVYLPSTTIENDLNLGAIEIPVYLPDISTEGETLLDLGSVEIPLYLPDLTFCLAVELNSALHRGEDDSANGPNPWVRNSNTPGAYDEDKAGTRTILRLNDTDWRMWWEAVEGVGDPTTLAYASSIDAGITWTKYDGGALLQPCAGPHWENDEIAPTDIYWMEDENAYWLYYHGGYDDPAGGFPNQVGLLSSTDGSLGLSWERYASNPIIPSGTEGTDDEYGANDAAIIKKSDTEWIALYQGEDSSGKKHILRATSVDGLNWTKDTDSGIVLDVGTAGEWDDNGIAAISRPIIDPNNNRWHCWYNGDDGSAGVNQFEVGYAYSDDEGKIFVKGANNPVQSANSEADSPDAGGASDVFWPVNDGDKVLVTYTGEELSTYTGPGGSPVRSICTSWIPLAQCQTPTTPGRHFWDNDVTTSTAVEMDPSLTLFNSTVYTIVARIKCYESGTSEFVGARHIYTEKPLPFNEEIYLRLNGLGELAGFHRTPTDAVNITHTGVRVDDNTWHNIAFRRNSSAEFDLVLDGSTVVSFEDSNPGVTSVTTNIAYGNFHREGGPDVGDAPLLGTISRIAVWDSSSITNAEIDAFLDNGIEPSAGAATWWHDPGTSDPEYDYTKNGNTGTVRGTVVVNADPIAGFDDLDVSLDLGATEIPLYLPDLTLEGDSANVLDLDPVEIPVILPSVGLDVIFDVPNGEIFLLQPPIELETIFDLGAADIPLFAPALTLEHEAIVGPIEIPVILPSLEIDSEEILSLGSIEIPLFLPNLSLDVELAIESIEIPVYLPSLSRDGESILDLDPIEIPFLLPSIALETELSITPIEIPALLPSITVESDLDLSPIEIPVYLTTVSRDGLSTLDLGSVEIPLIIPSVALETDRVISPIEIPAILPGLTLESETILDLGSVEIPLYLTDLDIRYSSVLTIDPITIPIFLPDIAFPDIAPAAPDSNPGRMSVSLLEGDCGDSSVDLGRRQQRFRRGGNLSESDGNCE